VREEKDRHENRNTEERGETNREGDRRKTQHGPVDRFVSDFASLRREVRSGNAGVDKHGGT
jgi:hypothetical protein